MASDPHEKVGILLVDDHPAKLMAYEVILQDLGEDLIKAASGKEALEQLLKHEVAVVLVDVCMPDLDGFQLAQMIREHPRFQNTAMIFISAIHLSDVDRLRGYAMGAVDYVPVPVIPEVLRAKVRVFVELYRKTRQLGRLNAERGWWQKPDPEGQSAVTNWKVLGRGEGLAWLALEPVTGRTHQLRVHSAAIGWPIVGDNIYGNGPRFGEPRLHLHSREIVIDRKSVV